MWPFSPSAFESKVLSKLSSLEKRITVMATNLDTLIAQVTASIEVETSAVVLIQGIAAQLEEAKTDPVAIQALADQLKASADSLSAAIVANTQVE